MTPDHTSREIVELLYGPEQAAVAAGCPLTDAWRDAEAEAERTYDAWRKSPSVDAYVVYLAAEDRAAAAQDELATWMNARDAWTAGRRLQLAG